MTELEQLRVKCDSAIRQRDDAEHDLALFNARIAELERDPKRWQPETAAGRYYYVGASGVVRDAVGSGYEFNTFPTEGRALEVATHFRRLGLAAQWGALLTDKAWDDAGTRYYNDAGRKTWFFAFPTAAQRDGFMADAEREGLL